MEANLNVQSKYDGQTALMLAAKNGHEKTVDALIKAEADMNVKTEHGRYSKTVIALLRSGARINSSTNPLTDYLCDGEKEKIIMILYAAGETIDQTKVQVTDFVKELKNGPSEMSLSHMSREAVRKHLIELDPHKNLFHRIPRLGFSSSLQEYLLYNVSLDDDEEELDNGN